MITSGLILVGEFACSAVLRPLTNELASCFWLIDTQSGPFDSLWVDASPENDAVVEEKWLDVPVCRNTSTTCWQKGTFPRVADHVIIDEWTYFYAMCCREADVPRRAEWIVPHIGKFGGKDGADFFTDLARYADLFLFHADGWWELYTSRPDWRQKFAAAFPTAFERSWREAGETPAITA